MALPTKQTFTAPTSSGNRSVEEPKVTAAITSTGAMQDDLYEYLDRDGATYAGALNSGLEHAFIGDQAVKSRNLYINGGSSTIKTSGNTVLNTFNSTFVSNAISIVVPKNNMIVQFYCTLSWIMSQTSSTSISAMSEIEVFIERFPNTGTPVAGTGTEVQSGGPGSRTRDRSGYQHSYLLGTLPLIARDIVSTAGTYRYYITAKEGASIAYNRTIYGQRSFYTYQLYNGFATS